MNKVLADRVLHEKICIIARRSIDFFCARRYNRYIPKTKGRDIHAKAATMPSNLWNTKN